jgi:hypothetical protein
MREWPESRAVIDLLARVTRVRLLQAVTTAMAAGLAVGAVVVLVLLFNGVGVRLAIVAGLALMMAGGVIGWARITLTDAASAAVIESRVPECRNVIITAAALLKDQGHTPAAVCRIVMYDASHIARRLHPSTLLPWMRPAARAVVAAALFAAAFLVKVPGATDWLPSLATEASSAPSVSQVRVTITPPSYSGLQAETLTNPERVAALAGSRVALVITGGGVRMSIETAQGTTVIPRADSDAFTTELTLNADGFVAITPFDIGDNAGPRRLIGLTSTPDRPPVPRVTLPGKDLFLREATAALPITVEATDDLALRSLRLAYTKVAGVGESFTFTEGETPLTLTRTSGRQWSGTGTLNLMSLGLEVGDMVVYRAVAADARPDGRPIESDAFIVEIVSASEAMAEGFSIDDTMDKYAISQQMVIVKTERLIAKATGRPTPTADTILQEALSIAAEQRTVRAELVFMTGGHFEDEFVEAAHEHEITDGRMDNSGRADLGRAIREMSRASSELTDSNLKVALEAERAALEAMQRALSRRRFILRTLTQREAIDNTRRLTGTLSDLARTRRDSADPAVPPHVLALRTGLAQLGDLAARPTLTRQEADVVTSITAALLKVASADRAVVDIVAVLSKAGEAMTAGRQADARTTLTDAATRMTTLLRAAAPVSTADDEAELRRLRGALADVQRRGGGR